MTKKTLRKNDKKGMVDDNDDVKWTSQFARELHAPVRTKFKKRVVIAPSVDNIWAIDLADMSAYSKANKGYKWLLMIIDCFSKYGHVVPMKRKTAVETADAFSKLFRENTPPKKCWADAGKEFWNAEVSKVFKKYNVKLYKTQNELKSCIVERFIRSFKRHMYMMFTSERTRNYISVLDDMVQRYNNTYHRSIGCSPSKAREEDNFQSVYDHLYPPKKKNYRKKPPVFKIGDLVRITKQRKKFYKGYTPNYTEEQFKVTGIQNTDPVTYKLSDLQNEEIVGTFYRQNMVKSEQEIYFIEKVLARRVKNGKKEIKVQWSGYSKRFTDWIDSDTVIDTTAKRRNIPDQTE